MEDAMSDFDKKPSGESSDDNSSSLELLVRFKVSAQMLLRYAVPVLVPMLLGGAWWGVWNLFPGRSYPPIVKPVSKQRQD
jgi:hypothetical protein